MGGKVVRPVITSVEGAEEILARLGDFSHQLGLSEGIRDRLSRASVEQPDMTYEVDGGRWVTVRQRPARGQPPEGTEDSSMRQTDGKHGAGNAGQLDDRLAHESERVQLLLARVEALERRVKHIEDNGSVGGAPATRLDVVPGAGTPPASGSDAGSDLDFAGGSPADVSGAGQEQDGGEPDGGDAAADPEEYKSIEVLPESRGILEILQMLVGDDVNVVQDMDDPPALVADASMFYSYLLDDENRQVGAILFDMAGVVRLGGTMMMLPEEALTEMLGSGEVTEEALDGCSEIMNNLSSLINTTPGNPHVRSEQAKPLDGSEPEWFHSPSLRSDMMEMSQQARIVFIAR